MMILIVGSTGLLGGLITQGLLTAGKSVRILVREGSNYQPHVAAGAQPVIGDLKDRASLDAACLGVQTVITTANAVQRGGPDTLESVDHHGTISLIDAAKAAGVRHFIYTSGFSSDTDSPNPLTRIKLICEQHLKESGLVYTILKPGVFMEIWAGAVIGIPLQMNQPVTLVGEGKRAIPFLSVADVAAYAVAAVDNPASHNASLLFGADRSYSWLEVIESAGRAMGRELPVRFVGLGEPVPGLPDGMVALMNGLEMADVHLPLGDLPATYGVAPTPLDETMRRMWSGASN